MSPHRTVVLAALLCSAAAAAQSGGNIYLSQGKVYFQALEFEKCVQRMEQAARWQNSTRRELAEIELYTGLCKFSLGQTDESADHFTAALGIDPTLELPPGVSPRIAEVFNEVAERVRPAAAGRAEAQQSQGSGDAPANGNRELVLVPREGPAPSPVDQSLTARPEPPSRVLPITLGGVSVAALATGGIFGAMAKAYEAEHNDRRTFHEEAQVAGKRAQDSAFAANVAFAIAGAAAAGAVTTWLLDL